MRFVIVNDIMYEIVAQIPDEKAIDTETLKQQYKCDVVLRQNNTHFLANVVQEAEFDDNQVIMERE